LTQIFNFFRITVWRSVAAKLDALETTFMRHLVPQAAVNATRISVRGSLAGQPGNSAPNLTPHFNEIGTIAEARISPKRLVRFGTNLHCVIAGA